jgi:Cu+-exporting ATPase
VSFIISFLYNIVGFGFAVRGTLSPLISAILMPLSSISVILFATGATYFMAYKAGFVNSPFAKKAMQQISNNR